MTILKAFCVLCAATCCLTDVTLQESKNRKIYSSDYHSQNRFYTEWNKSQDESYFPYDYDVKSPFEADSWRRNYSYLNKIYPIENYSKLRENELVDPTSFDPAIEVFTTRGRGRVVVQRRGETVYVPNELSRKRAHKGTISVRVVDRNENELKTNKYRSLCRECPSDQTVVAPKGSLFVFLPEPCPTAPKMWNHISGPKPGNKIQEGVHIIRGRIGPKKRFCEYSFQVIVNRCEPLKVKEGESTECSAENAWGSICIISCGEEKEPIGPTELQCREDLTWSNPLPKCKSKADCLTPKIKAKTKFSCQKSNKSHSETDYLPNGSTCTFKQNGKDISITCKDGKWLKSRKSKKVLLTQNKNNNNQTLVKKDPCNPNPCQNGGICLKTESDAEPSICKCRPQTQGAYCELRECYYNICENDGFCIYKDEKRICYCSSDYSGEKCQNYRRN